MRLSTSETCESQELWPQHSKYSESWHVSVVISVYVCMSLCIKQDLKDI